MKLNKKPESIEDVFFRSLVVILGAFNVLGGTIILFVMIMLHITGVK